jgi:hypothetical protein
MFRYTPNPRVNADSDTFTVIADEGPGGSLDSTVTWVNANHVPVAVAPPTVWPADPTTGAVTVYPNIVHPDAHSTWVFSAPISTWPTTRTAPSA